LQIKDDIQMLTDDIKEGSLQLRNMRLEIENLKYMHRNLLLQCKVTCHLSDEYCTSICHRTFHALHWEV